VAYAIWLLYLALRSRAVTVIYVVHNEPEPLFRLQISLLRRLAVRHRLVFVAHSPAIARLVSKFVGGTPEVVPLPFRSAPHVERKHEAGAPTRFAFLGLGHRNKGLDLVVGAVRNSAELLATGGLSFAIQCYLPFADAQTEELLAEARALGYLANVEILVGELTPDRYVFELQRSDVILIPHRLETYRFALSGVFADAMGAGRAVVVADGSYMSEIIRSNGAGVMFKSGDVASLTEAIREAAQRATELLERAEAASHRWGVEQGPVGFVSRILGFQTDTSRAIAIR
jgi:glycosyltransferase involved in cell wall biosynthesis